MEEILRHGTSTRNPKLSRASPTTNHSTSKDQASKTTCKSGAPTADGGKSSKWMENTSRISRTTSALMFQEERMLKVRMFKSGIDTMVQIRDGQSNILMK